MEQKTMAMRFKFLTLEELLKAEKEHVGDNDFSVLLSATLSAAAVFLVNVERFCADWKSGKKDLDRYFRIKWSWDEAMRVSQGNPIAPAVFAELCQGTISLGGRDFREFVEIGKEVKDILRAQIEEFNAKARTGKEVAE
ncbi:MAG: hypothetical protein K6F50_08480 [Kiritimatiellae bacterium]|nr:hypothetical protein [Kiritimatiellia bacterium]